MAIHPNYEDPHVKALIRSCRADERKALYWRFCPYMAWGLGSFAWFKYGAEWGLIVGVVVCGFMVLYPLKEQKEADAHLAHIEGRD